MEPQVLVLDEPCAGLDPRGREEILGLIRDLHRESGATIVMVSHSMDDVASLAERVIVMNHGEVVMDGAPRDVFSCGEELRGMGLDVPQAVQLAAKLRERGYDIPEGIYRIEEIKAEIVKINETLPAYKHIKNLTFQTAALVKTSTAKVKRHEEMAKDESEN